MILHRAIPLCLLAAFAAVAPGEPRQAPQPEFRTDVPKHAADVVLARPTTDSVTVSVLAYAKARACIAYGTSRQALDSRTAPFDLDGSRPAEIVLRNLRPNTRYDYEVRDAGGAAAVFGDGAAGSFHTRRPAGAAFCFTVTADSHLDERTDPRLYERTLANALADAPDFHVDLGDTFMTGKHASRDEAARQYLAQRYYFGTLCRSAPLFLVLGNHDGEEGRRADGSADSLPVWANAMRKRYFPNPVPDGFYTGNATKHPQAGLLQNYYAWTWGDALFIVLDPFWPTPRARGGQDNWTRTLGAEQYRWLARTLADSQAVHRFVFIHHLVGGADRQGRGGVEAAGLYEWGGRNADGSEGFSQNRPGWEMPIHQLLLKHGATAVFHGHDHFFSHQEMDGIAYILVPQPGHWQAREKDLAREYGYVAGTSLPSAGHVRVKVSPDGAIVEYVRAFLADSETGERQNGQVAHRCVLPAGSERPGK